MTHPTDEELDALIEAVDRGLPSPTNWRKFSAVPAGNNDIYGPILAHRAYHGSLDAAKELHEVLLPGWALLGMSKSPSGIWIVSVYEPKGDEWPKWTAYPSKGATANKPARAWLLAILKAYRTQVTQ